MLKKIRLAALAAVLLIVAAQTAPLLVPQALAQSPAAAPAAPAAAEAPAAPAAPKAPAAKAAEVIDNPYGLEALWKGGDIVA
ncbi:MAG: MotA/TolQ/ExbB proton channel family protein, partial [Betaproteobacteria bacterium]